MRRRHRRDTDWRLVAAAVAGGLALAANAHPPGRPPGGGSHAAHLAHLSRAPAAASPAAGSRAATAISFVRAQLGKPYGYGATGPDSYDCSSLLQAAWGAAGVNIPRTSEAQWAQLPHVTSPQPGDLVFYTGSPIDAPPGHVTMFLGGGLMGEAYATGTPIRITALRAGIWGYARPGGG